MCVGTCHIDGTQFEEISVPRGKMMVKAQSQPGSIKWVRPELWDRLGPDRNVRQLARNGALQTEGSEDTVRCWGWSPETQEWMAEIRKLGDAQQCRLIFPHAEFKLTCVPYFTPYAVLAPKSLKTATPLLMSSVPTGFRAPPLST